MLAIIPARSGSKLLKNKNILKIKNKPLIAYTIEAAKKSKYVSKVVVITDSPKIALISKKYGAEIPFLRPKNISKDSSDVMDTYLYTLDFYKKKKIIYKSFIALLATNPLRDHNDIDKAIQIFKKKKADSVIGMSEAPFPISWNKLVKKNKIHNFNKDFDSISNRQKHTKTYIPNGSIFILKEKKLRKYREYYFKNTFAYIMPQKKSVDIDNYFDFKIAQFLIENKKKSNE
jgi:N-acylneuraminate cytidylyltransferase/CMP-N,N'-diacetyllegionaminic acid synthase